MAAMVNNYVYYFGAVVHTREMHRGAEPVPQELVEVADAPEDDHRYHGPVKATSHERKVIVMLGAIIFLLIGGIILIAPFFYTMYKSHRDIGRLASTMADMADAFHSRQKDVLRSVDQMTRLVDSAAGDANTTAIAMAWDQLNNLATLMGDEQWGASFAGMRSFFVKGAPELTSSITSLSKVVVDFIRRVSSA